MEKNIDKGRFSRNLEKWANETEPQSIDWLFSKFLFNDLKTLISNVTYYFQFTDPRFTYEDVESELLMHLILKREKFRPYTGNLYNVAFTICKMRFYDILRSYKAEHKKIEDASEVIEYHLSVNQFVELEFEEPESEQPARPKPIAVRDNYQELSIDPELPGQLTQLYKQTVSLQTMEQTSYYSEDSAAFKALYNYIFELILKHFNKVADGFNRMP